MEIVYAGESKGWKVTLWSMEVACIGFPTVSLGNYLRDTGSQEQIVQNI